VSSGAARPILLVEPDRDRGRALARQLIADGYAVELARSAEHARILARAAGPEIALLGPVEPPRGALALLEEIRAPALAGGPWDRGMPVILAGHDGDELDMLRAFEAGADDFVAPAAGYLELRARVRAVLRRAGVAAGERRWLEVGPLAVDIGAHRASLHGHVLELRRMEFELLAHMAREPTRVFSREELLRSVWGYRGGASTRTLDSHASRLRRKLAADPTRRWLVNVWGVGYRLT
jgi:DNA-binding response OmpR family regulator